MMRSKFVAIILAAQLLITGAACKDKSKSAVKVAAGQPPARVVEEESTGNLPVLAPPANASRNLLLINAAHNGDLAMVRKLLA